MAYHGHDAQRDDDSSHKRPYSIDLTLELERQLENESLPPTPAHNVRSASGHQLPDPNVMASIIVQLRQSLADVTEERDALRHRLSEIQSQDSFVKDTLRDMAEKCTRAQSELEAARQKIKDDEEAISMLRAKVEESRRGVMRLQTESRRMSQGPGSLDLSRTSFAAFASPSSSNKRASFTPLTGTGARPNVHRRISSVSDSNIVISDGPSDMMSGGQVLTVPDNRHLSSNPRRVSGIFRASPSQLEPSQDVASAEINALRRELKATKDELEETRHALSESNEAREASETCVKALREFIGENDVGGAAAIGGDSGSIKLPLPPTMTTGEEVDPKKSSGWRFKLWALDTTVKNAPNNSPTAISSGHISSPSTATPFSRKLGGLFGSKTSISSVSSQPQRSIEGRSHGSDSSSIEESVAEPISPTGVESGSGVIVRDSLSSSSEFGNMDLVRDGQKGIIDSR